MTEVNSMAESKSRHIDQPMSPVQKNISSSPSVTEWIFAVQGDTHNNEAQMEEKHQQGIWRMCENKKDQTQKNMNDNIMQKSS
jgi:hypothetical protein